MKAMVAMCGRKSATILLLTDSGETLRHREDYRPKLAPLESDSGVDPDSQPQCRIACESQIGVSINRWSTMFGREPSNGIDGTILDPVVTNDTMPVVDQFRRFQRVGWVISVVCDANDLPIESERIARSGLPIAGEGEAYRMSYDPACLAGNSTWRETAADCIESLLDRLSSRVELIGANHNGN